MDNKVQLHLFTFAGLRNSLIVGRRGLKLPHIQWCIFSRNEMLTKNQNVFLLWINC